MGKGEKAKREKGEKGKRKYVPVLSLSLFFTLDS